MATTRTIYRVKDKKTGAVYAPGYTDEAGAEGFISYQLFIPGAKREDFEIFPEQKEVIDRQADLIAAAALVLAQAKEGKPMDLIALADCIDLAGGKEVRKSTRAAVKAGKA